MQEAAGIYRTYMSYRPYIFPASCSWLLPLPLVKLFSVS